MMNKKELMIWSEAPGRYKEIINVAIKRYKRGVNYRGNIIVTSCDWKDYISNIERAFIEEKGPDIFSIEPGGPLNYLVGKGFVKPLNNYFNEEIVKDKFSPLSISSVKVNELLYSIPISMNNMQLFVNKKIINKYRIKYPDDVGQLIEIAKFLEKKNITCIATGFIDKWAAIDTFVVLSQQLSKKKNKNLLRDAERGLIPWTSEEFVMVIENIKMMADNNIFPADVTKINFHKDAFNLWCEDKALFLWPGNNAIVASIPQDNVYDAVWFPRISKGEKVLTGGVALSWSVYSKSIFLEKCIEILKEMISEETGNDLLSKGIAHSGLINKEIISESEIISKINSQQNFALDRRIYNPKMYNAIGEAVCEVILGTKTAYEALKKIG